MRVPVMAVALLLSLMASQTGFAANAGVYRWKDRSGELHFDDKQLTAQRLDKAWLDSRKVGAQPDWAGVVPPEFAEEVEQRCGWQKERLDNYRYAGRVWLRDEQGVSRVLSAAERQTMIQQAERETRRYCASGAARRLYVERLKAREGSAQSSARR